MNYYLRASSLLLPVCLITGALCWCEVAYAQSQEKPAEPAKAQTPAQVAKPTRNSGWVTTTDPLALLSMRKRPASTEVPAAEAVKATDSASSMDPTTRRAEMAELERQIQNKQKRVLLLMRLFVTDEKPFLVNPEDTNVEPEVKERRKYEQDELRYETAELAKLKARLEELKKEEIGSQ